jgi:hypothetical protein
MQCMPNLGECLHAAQKPNCGVKTLRDRSILRHKNDDKLVFITPPCLSFASLVAKLFSQNGFLGKTNFFTFEEKIMRI